MSRRAWLLAPLVTLLALLGPAAAAGTAANGADPLDGARVEPVPTSGPSWYDLAYHRQVTAAGTAGARLPAGASMPAAYGLAMPGIRPGTWLVTVTTKPVG